MRYIDILISSGLSSGKRLPSGTHEAHKSVGLWLQTRRNTNAFAGLALIWANQRPACGEVRHLQNAEIADMPTTREVKPRAGR